MNYKCPKCGSFPEEGQPAFQRTTETIVSRWSIMDSKGCNVTAQHKGYEGHEAYETVNLLLCLNCDFEGNSTEFEASEEEGEN